MIQVNLLPHELRPVKRTPLPYIISVLVLLIALGVVASIYLQQVARTSALRGQVAETQRDFDELKDIVDEAERLTELKQQLAVKIQTINEIVNDRIIWSEQLWRLSKLAPENFWYSEFEQDTKQVTVTVTEPDPNDPTKMVTRPDNRTVPMLRVSGYVIEGQEGSKDVSPFLSAVEEDPEFAAMFELDKQQFGDTDFNGYPVRSFTIEFLIDRGGAAK